MSMVAQIAAYEEITDLMVSAAPERVAQYRVSEKLQRRYDELVAREKEGKINDIEREELDTILIINHILYLAKIKALRLSAAA